VAPAAVWAVRHQRGADGLHPDLALPMDFHALHTAADMAPVMWSVSAPCDHEGTGPSRSLNEQSCCSTGLSLYRQGLDSHSASRCVWGRPNDPEAGNRTAFALVSLGVEPPAGIEPATPSLPSMRRGFTSPISTPHLLDLAGGRRHPRPGHRRADGPPGQRALRPTSGQLHRAPLPPHHPRDGHARHSGGRGAPGGRPGNGRSRPRSATLVTLPAEAATRRHLLADCWQTTLQERVGEVFWLVELRGFEPLTSCMP
jgi:hypothetical protein